MCEMGINLIGSALVRAQYSDNFTNDYNTAIFFLKAEIIGINFR